MHGDPLVLDARPLDRGLEVTVAAGWGLEKRVVEASYRVYLAPTGVGARELARGIEGLDAWVEEWLLPPWYASRGSVVVVEGPLPRVLSAARRLEALGVARRVNRYPGPLVEALWRLRVRPGCPLGGPCRVLEPPRGLVVASVEAYSWHGPIAGYWEEPLYYRVECCGWAERLPGPGEALEALLDLEPHLVSARGPVRLQLQGALGARRPPWLWFEPDRNLVGPEGLILWMRVSWLPYHEAHGAPIGKVLTAAEARRAYEWRYLVDDRAPRGEALRPLRELVASDMAGAARIPEPGLYWRVVQLDYSSLYPRLIALHNISSETVDSPCPGDPEPAAPGYTSHRICTARRGLVSTVLGELVALRDEAKKRRLDWASEALKWILVSGFGYLGYRNSLFGSITAYETVTALARKALAVAEETAEAHGYRLVHSLIDSIFIEPVDPIVDPGELAARIGEAAGVPVRVEAEYHWLYIPATRRGRGAVNKYYGALKGGGVKARGIAMVRRDTPPIIRGAQASAIAALAKARDPSEWPSALREAWRRIQWYHDLIATGRAPPQGLVIAKRPSPDTARRTPWARAAGKAPAWPREAKYIMAPGGRPHPAWLGPPEAYDTSYYLRLLASASLELPPPATRL